MPDEFAGIASSEQLDVLTQVLEDYSRSAGIQPGTPAYEEVASRIMKLFANGLSTADELKAALQTRRTKPG